MATLVPSLVALRAEINRLAPGRDKASDGWIGDPAHQATQSDHNPDDRGSVHAIDVDKDLREPDLTMQKIADHLVRRCRTGQEKRITYVIFNGRIASPVQGWAWRSYGGANPHDKHMHVSASDTPARESDTSTYHLEELVAVTDAEIERIANRTKELVWKHEEPNPYDDGRTTRRMGGDLRMMEYRDDIRAQATNVHRLDNQVIPLLKQILAVVQGNDPDEAAIGAAVLAGLGTLLPQAIRDAGLTPEALADAIPDELAEQVVDILAARMTD